MSITDVQWIETFHRKKGVTIHHPLSLCHLLSPLLRFASALCLFIHHLCLHLTWLKRTQVWLSLIHHLLIPTPPQKNKKTTVASGNGGLLVQLGCYWPLVLKQSLLLLWSSSQLFLPSPSAHLIALFKAVDMWYTSHSCWRYSDQVSFSPLILPTHAVWHFSSNGDG